MRFFDQAKYLDVLVNDSLKDDDDDIQRQVKLLYCAVNKLRGSGVTDRRGELPPWQAKSKNRAPT